MDKKLNIESTKCGFYLMHQQEFVIENPKHY